VVWKPAIMTMMPCVHRSAAAAMMKNTVVSRRGGRVEKRRGAEYHRVALISLDMK
jgi:hypothetical protein